jgi:hypothetical protein
MWTMHSDGTYLLLPRGPAVSVWMDVSQILDPESSIFATLLPVSARY